MGQPLELDCLLKGTAQSFEHPTDHVRRKEFISPCNGVPQNQAPEPQPGAVDSLLKLIASRSGQPLQSDGF